MLPETLPPSPAEQVSPSFGFTALLTAEQQIHMQMLDGSTEDPVSLVLTTADAIKTVPDFAHAGMLQRDAELYSAVCDYLNRGGNMKLLRQNLEKIDNQLLTQTLTITDMRPDGSEVRYWFARNQPTEVGMGWVFLSGDQSKAIVWVHGVNFDGPFPAEQLDEPAEDVGPFTPVKTPSMLGLALGISP